LLTPPREFPTDPADPHHHDLHETTLDDMTFDQRHDDLVAAVAKAHPVPRREIDKPTDSGSSPPTPCPAENPMTSEAARHVDVAAEAIRGLNHATQPCGEGLTGPGDVYDTVAGLELLASRLPQALTQLQRYLAHETAAGQVLIVDGPHAGNPDAVLNATAHALEQASAAACSLTEALAHAHELLGSAARPAPRG
jgi:hypothetical protein